MIRPETLSQLTAAVPEARPSEFRGQTRVVVPRESLAAALKLLRDELKFDLLVDITCVDYLDYRDATDRFGLVYLLANTETNERLTVRVFLNEPELTVPSVVPLWEGANWLEREVWDMFGIVSRGIPIFAGSCCPKSSRPIRCARTIRCKAAASGTISRC